MQMQSLSATKRYVSLDVLRGISVAFMCIVDNPGTWIFIFPPLRHASWVGCTPTDLVFPFFLFCTGCAMAFSFSRQERVSNLTYWKVIKRGLLIFLVGLLCNLFPFFPTYLYEPSATFGDNYLYWLSHRRIFGVLQRIGISYLIAGLIALWLKKPARILLAIGVLMTVYTLVFLVFGTEPGPFTLEGNVSRKIDLALLGDGHVYHGHHNAEGYPVAFDPEGPLGSVTGACTALLGYLIGSLILKNGRRDSAAPSLAQSSLVPTITRIMAYGVLSLVLGMILGLWIPIIKPLWTASFVLYSGGWAMIALAILMYLIEVRGFAKPFIPFKIMGTNALVAFVLCALLATTLPRLGFDPSRWFGANEYLSLLWALIFTLFVFCIQWALYRKKIIIKV